MAGFPEEVIRRVADANDIVDVIGAYLPLKRAGTTYKALCPFHSERTPSFNVNPQKQMFYCFGCQKGGGVIRFVMDYENTDFRTALTKLAQRANVALPEEGTAGPEDQARAGLRQQLLQIHFEAAEWFHTLLMRSEAGAPGREYLKGRRITGDTAREWRIGFAPESWDALLNWAYNQKYSEAIMRASGLFKLKDEANPNSRIYDRFRNRVMFPICNDFGEVIGFSGRTLDKEAVGAKYVNSPETPLFHKGSVLFGLHKSKRAIAKARTAVVMEGQIDLISSFTAGVENVIAPQGTAFTEKQARLLRRYAEEVVLCFDADNAGQNAATKSLPILLKLGFAVRVAQMPAGEDPDSMIRQGAEGVEAFRNLIQGAQEFFDFQISRASSTHDLGTARGRVDYARKMAEMVAHVEEPVLREGVIQRVAMLLAVPEKDVRDMTVVAARAAKKQAANEKNYEERMAQRQNRAGGGEPGAPEPEYRGESVDQDYYVPDPPAREPRKPGNTIKILCQLALNHAESREYLRTRPNREDLLAQTTDGDLLQGILEANFEPGNASSVTAYFSTLDGLDEALLSAILQNREPDQPEAVLKDCWAELWRARIRARQGVLQSRLRQPGLASEELTEIQKEFLDLQKLLQNIGELTG